MNGEMLKTIFWDNWVVRYIVRPSLIVYIICVLFTLVFANACIFPGNHAKPTYQDSAKIIKLTTPDGVKISARYVPDPKARYTILFSHGNGEDLGDNEDLYQLLNYMGYSVLAYDYHGYGTSEGNATEKNCYQDINAAYAYLTDTLRVPANRIIIFGRSVGGGPSVDLATREPVAGLILQSTFTSAYRSITRIPLLPFDKFRSLNKIGRVSCPVLVMHGTDDRVIPFDEGTKLYQAANQPKQFFWIQGAGHNDVAETGGEPYFQVIMKFIELVDKVNR